MTGKAVHWRALENTVHMAARTCRAAVRTSQFESCQVMVKPGRFPGVGIVAGFAILAKGPIMMIIASMTGKAVHRCALEDIV